MIKVTLKDNVVKEYNEGVTVLDIAKDISEALPETPAAVLSTARCRISDILSARIPRWRYAHLTLPREKSFSPYGFPCNGSGHKEALSRY